MEKFLHYTEKLGRLSHVYTLAVVMIAWIIFRSDNVTDAFCYLGNLVGINSTGVADGVFLNLLQSGAFVIIVSILLSAPLYQFLCKKIRSVRIRAEEILRSVTCIVLFLLSLAETIASTYNPFIYFNFFYIQTEKKKM